MTKNKEETAAPENAAPEKKQIEKKAPHVFQAIDAVREALAREGIGKDRRNDQQKYSFRGIDDVYNALSALLAENCLSIMPKHVERHGAERETKSGGVMFTAVVKVVYEFISSRDGSTYLTEMYGEGMDTGDKATNKAMSAAYKYVCLQVFSIPTEGGSVDADANTPESLKAKSVFKTPELRQQFFNNVSRSFAESQTLDELKELANLNAARFKEMDAGNLEDQNAVADLRKAYGASNIRLNAAKIANQHYADQAAKGNQASANNTKRDAVEDLLDRQQRGNDLNDPLPDSMR